MVFNIETRGSGDWSWFQDLILHVSYFDGDNLVLHPGGESLVEPEVVPPLHRHEVPKPLIKRRVP